MLAILIKLQFPSFLVVHGTCVYVCSFGKRNKKSGARRGALVRGSRSSLAQKANNETKTESNKKISRALAESLFFFSPGQKRKFRQSPCARVRASAPPSRCARFFFPLRLAVPLINETPYASFITFVVPLWIRPKSFEPAPHHSPQLLPTKRNPLPSPQKRTIPRILSPSCNVRETTPGSRHGPRDSDTTVSGPKKRALVTGSATKTD